ncbi:MAG TPA: peptidylprolyl isomerase [Thermoanaerobaculia bacterium]
MKKTIFALAIALTAFTASAAQLLEGIVVRVGDRIVTRTQYERRLADIYREIEQTQPADKQASIKAESKATLVQDMINELLIKDRADRLGVTVTDAEVAEAISRLKQQYGITTDEQFNTSLKQSGLTRTEMELRLRDTIVSNKVFGRELRSREDLSDPELRERYNREKDRYRLPERARLREIVILRPEDPSKVEEARTRANEVAEAAKKPTVNFANLATTMSEASSKESGGDLGEVAKGDLVATIDTAVFSAANGAVVGPIETKSAWHIVKVEQRLPSEVPSFDTVKDRLRRDVSEETFQRDYKAYIDTLRKDAFIQINEPMLPKS